MAIGRRKAPPVPGGSLPKPEQAWRHFLRLAEYVKHAYSGHPGPHEITHLAGGLDALTTPGTPESLGDANDAGVGPSYSYEDHTHSSGLTTKGDILAHNGTDNVRLPAGTNGHILRANSGATNGVEYKSDAEAAQTAVYLALVM